MAVVGGEILFTSATSGAASACLVAAGTTGSGGGDIFGTTGGVMEAALRTAYEEMTGDTLKDVEFKEVRAVEGLREREIDIKGTKINVAVANGLTNGKKLLDQVIKGEKQFHLIEIKI